MTPRRVGTRTYSFTGRVYPALNQRLVSLYRNGVLFGQGPVRCQRSPFPRATRCVVLNIGGWSGPAMKGGRGARAGPPAVNRWLRVLLGSAATLAALWIIVLI